MQAAVRLCPATTNILTDGSVFEQWVSTCLEKFGNASVCELVRTQTAGLVLVSGTPLYRGAVCTPSPARPTLKLYSTAATSGVMIYA